MKRIQLKEASLLQTETMKKIAPSLLGEKAFGPHDLVNNKTLIATCDGETVGFIICQFFKKDELQYNYYSIRDDQPMLYITTCYAHEKFEKSRIISMLLKEAVRCYGKNRSVLVAVWSNNECGNLYAALLRMMGFKKIKSISEYWGKHDTNCPICGKDNYCHCSCDFYFKSK